MKKLFISLLMLPSLAVAGEWWGVGTLVSYHVNTGKQFNQRNYGLGLEYRSGDMAYMAGQYKNSDYRNSVYAMAAWTPLSIGSIRAGCAIGAVNGYRGANNGGIGPAVVGIVKMEMEKAGLNLVFIPPLPEKSPFTIAMQAKFRF